MGDGRRQMAGLPLRHGTLGVAHILKQYTALLTGLGEIGWVWMDSRMGRARDRGNRSVRHQHPHQLEREHDLGRFTINAGTRLRKHGRPRPLEPACTQRPPRLRTTNSERASLRQAGGGQHRALCFYFFSQMGGCLADDGLGVRP